MDNLTFQANVYDDYAIFIPAGTWHNVVNTGNTPMKLYSIYAPPEHPPHGTIHKTKKRSWNGAKLLLNIDNNQVGRVKFPAHKHIYFF